MSKKHFVYLLWEPITYMQKSHQKWWTSEKQLGTQKKVEYHTSLHTHTTYSQLPPTLHTHHLLSTYPTYPLHTQQLLTLNYHLLSTHITYSPRAQGWQRSSGTGRRISPACTLGWSPPPAASSAPCCTSGGTLSSARLVDPDNHNNNASCTAKIIMVVVQPNNYGNCTTRQ